MWHSTSHDRQEKSAARHEAATTSAIVPDDIESFHPDPLPACFYQHEQDTGLAVILPLAAAPRRNQETYQKAAGSKPTPGASSGAAWQPPLAPTTPRSVETVKAEPKGEQQQP